MEHSHATTTNGLKRSDSISQVSETSQTAQDYIASQLSLEADAREALPYQFDTCTKPLGPLRQSVYACLTCSPPPASPHQQFAPAGVCYSCSISCHGEHTLVELFTKRDFVCDCGTTRLANSGTPCSLRLNSATGRKGGITGEEARQGNKYNQNYQGKFCACGDEYDPEKEKGTMFQCIGLGTVEDGGCGEDWWHPECLMGLPRNRNNPTPQATEKGTLQPIKEEEDDTVEKQEQNVDVSPLHKNANDEVPPPAGFPDEDDFDHLICYKCAGAFPWIKQYANSPGFLVAKTSNLDSIKTEATTSPKLEEQTETKKRKADDQPEESQDSKKARPSDPESEPSESAPQLTSVPKHSTLPPMPSADTTLYLKEDFRDHLCRCAECFPRLAKHPQLLEEEVNYEPPLSESDEGENDAGSVAGRSVNSGSLLDRGEAALSSMDRVRAIEGVMAYNHVRDKVKAFLQPFAESGQAVGAEDIKAYFAKLRGDEQALRNAPVQASGPDEPDNRREQGGY